MNKNNTNKTKSNTIWITRKQKWKEKQLHRYFKRQISEISHEKACTCLRKRNLKKKKEGSVSWHINLLRIFNTKVILPEEQQWYYLTHSLEDKGVHIVPKGICSKVNVIARLEFELAPSIPLSIALTFTPRWHPPLENLREKLNLF